MWWKAVLVMSGIVLLAGCNVMPVKYSDGTHWAILENPLGNKSIDVEMEEGTVTAEGLSSYISGFTISGKNLHYTSIPVMGCSTTRKSNRTN